MKVHSSLLVVLLIAATSLWSSVNATCKPACIDCKTKGKCPASTPAPGAGTAATTAPPPTTAGAPPPAPAPAPAAPAPAPAPAAPAPAPPAPRAAAAPAAAAPRAPIPATTTPPPTSLEIDGTCADTEACTMLGDTPVCKPIAMTTCNCGGKKKGCDPFKNTQPIFCVASDVFIDPAAECDATNNELCVGEGQCTVASPGSSTSTNPDTVCVGNTEIDYFAVPKACTTGVFCNKDKLIEITNCTATQYFDVETGDCAPFPPSNPCGCGKEKCPVITDCTKFVVCVDGASDEETCPDDAATKFFDPENESCGATEEGICKKYKGCELLKTPTSSSTTVTTTPSVITTPTPSSITPSTITNATTLPAATTTSKPSGCNAANVNKRYPHETDCRKYYTCRLVSRSTYEYVVSKCPGTLAYNPSNNYCDLPEKVNPPCTQ